MSDCKIFIVTKYFLVSLFFTGILLPGSWKMKIINAETSDFPKIKSDFILYENKGKFIGDLTAKNIEIFEDKKRLPEFELKLTESSEKLSMAILLDVSGSMKGEKIKYAKEAASELFRLLNKKDEATLITFGSEIKISSGFTNDFPYLIQSLSKAALTPNTHLYDGIMEAATLFSPIEKKRNAIILITDGKDDGSKAKIDDAIAEAVKRKIEIFSIGIGKDADLEVLGRLSNMTESGFYGVIEPIELKYLLMNIYTLLTRCYRVTYTTPDSLVEVSSAKRELSIFVNYSQLRKNQMLEFSVPRHVPVKSSLSEYFPFLMLILLVLLVITLLVVLIKRKKKKATFITKDVAPDRYLTPDYGNDDEFDDSDKTLDWESKLKEDIRDKKTVIIKKGKSQTEESLAYLVLRSKKFGMHIYEIKQTEIIIGRSSQCDIELDDETISRTHAKVRLIDKAFYVDDLGSSNGTKVNGVIDYHHELKDGDVIDLGGHELVFKCV